VKAGLVGLAAIFLIALLLGISPGAAQSPPPAAASAPLPAPGFMPPYEVTKTVRSAGFEPLAPPLREGTTYVLRATDFRGILMRVVVDAHSGAIRAVNRIVPGPGPYGPVGMVTPPYGQPPAYGLPQDAEGLEVMPDEVALAPPPPPLAAPLHSVVRPSVSGPPLPRPRPAELAARDTKPPATPAVAPIANPDAKPDSKPDTKADAKPSAAAAPAPPSVAAAPRRPPPPPPINE
jgi:hypothetical protein